MKYLSYCVFVLVFLMFWGASLYAHVYLFKFACEVA